MMNIKETAKNGDDELLIPAIFEDENLTDWTYLQNDLKPMSIEQFNADIDKSLDDEKNGRIIEGNQLKDKIKSWK